jgi:uncharacterized protein with ParB-like and HNH nuclease domain
MDKKYSDQLSKLLTLSYIKKGCKLEVYYGEFRIHEPSDNIIIFACQNIYRKILGNTGETNTQILLEFFNDIYITIKDIKKNNDIPRISLYKRHLTESIKGLQNLSMSYTAESGIRAQIQTIIENIENIQLAELGE